MASTGERKRVNLTVSQKPEMIRKMESGMSVKEVSEEYGVKKKTVSDIRKAKPKLAQYASKHSVDSCSSKFATLASRKHVKTGKEEELEELVYTWYLERKADGVAVNSATLRSACKQFSKRLGIDFSCGWLWRFRKRYGLRYVQAGGKVGNADSLIIKSNCKMDKEDGVFVSQLLTVHDYEDMASEEEMVERKNLEEESELACEEMTIKIETEDSSNLGHKNPLMEELCEFDVAVKEEDIEIKDEPLEEEEKGNKTKQCENITRLKPRTVSEVQDISADIFMNEHPDEERMRTDEAFVDYDNCTLEQLIEQVHKYPCLYDSTSEGHRDAARKDTCWEDIAKTLRMDCKTVKHEWEKLEEYFRQVLARRKTSSVEAVKEAKLWRYEKQMEFLIPFINQRGTTTNTEEEKSDDGDDDETTQQPASELQPCVADATSINEEKDACNKEAQQNSSADSDVEDNKTEGCRLLKRLERLLNQLVPAIGARNVILEEIKKLKHCHEKTVLGEENPVATAKDCKSSAPKKCASKDTAPRPRVLPSAITWDDLQDYTLPVFPATVKVILEKKRKATDYMPNTRNRKLVIDVITSDLQKKGLLTPSRKGYTNILNALLTAYPYIGDPKCWRLSLRSKLKVLRYPLKSKSFQLLKDKFRSQRQKRPAETALESLRLAPTKRMKLPYYQPEEDPQAVLSHLEVLSKECRKPNPDILVITKELEGTFNYRRTRVHAESVTVVDILTEFPVLRQRNFFIAEARLCGIVQPQEAWEKLHSSLSELCKHTKRRSKKYRLYSSRYIEYFDKTLLEEHRKDHGLRFAFEVLPSLFQEDEEFLIVQSIENIKTPSPILVGEEDGYQLYINREPVFLTKTTKFKSGIETLFQSYWVFALEYPKQIQKNFVVFGETHLQNGG